MFWTILLYCTLSFRSPRVLSAFRGSPVDYLFHVHCFASLLLLDYNVVFLYVVSGFPN